MKKEEKIKNNNFKPVMTVNTILGIPAGTVLKFDSASGKYVSVSREEDISDSSYYYSGFAIAIDPAIVRQDTEHEFFEQAEEAKPMSIKEEKGPFPEKVEKFLKPEVEEVKVSEPENMPEEYYERNKVAVEDRPTVDEKITTEKFTLAPDSPVPEVGAVEKATIANEELPSQPQQVEGILTFECGLCHFKNPIHRMKYGLFFPVADSTRLNLKCQNCELETTVFYELV